MMYMVEEVVEEILRRTGPFVDCVFLLHGFSPKNGSQTETYKQLIPWRLSRS